MFLENVHDNFVESSHGNPFEIICHNLMSFLKMGWWSVHTFEYFYALHFYMVYDCTLGGLPYKSLMSKIKGLGV
jgi:hypothetical protein